MDGIVEVRRSWEDGWVGLVGFDGIVKRRRRALGLVVFLGERPSGRGNPEWYLDGPIGLIQ